MLERFSFYFIEGIPPPPPSHTFFFQLNFEFIHYSRLILIKHITWSNLLKTNFQLTNTTFGIALHFQFYRLSLNCNRAKGYPGSRNKMLSCKDPQRSNVPHVMPEAGQKIALLVSSAAGISAFLPVAFRLPSAPFPPILLRQKVVFLINRESDVTFDLKSFVSPPIYRRSSLGV